MRIVILGAGNVANHLVKMLIENALQVTQVYNRTLEKAKELAENYRLQYTDKISELEKADLYIICSSDIVITELSYSIPYKDSLVVHTSGATPMNVLKGDYRKGVLYPLQTFTKEIHNIRYDKIPFFIEAEHKKDEDQLVKIVERISRRYQIMNSEQRLKLHMSAVWANNFSNYMFKVAQDICEENEVPFKYLKPLIQQTVSNLDVLTPNKSQTGPALRNDTATIEKHLKLITDDKLKRIYTLISQSIHEKFSK